MGAGSEGKMHAVKLGTCVLAEAALVLFRYPLDSMRLFSSSVGPEGEKKEECRASQK